MRKSRTVCVVHGIVDIRPQGLNGLRRKTYRGCHAWKERQKSAETNAETNVPCRVEINCARAVSYCPPSEFSHVFSAFPLLMKRLLRYFIVLQFLYMSECTFHSVLNVFGVVFGLLDCNVTDNL